MGDCIGIDNMAEPGDLHVHDLDYIPVSDTVLDSSDTELVHDAVNMNSLDDDFEKWDAIQCDA